MDPRKDARPATNGASKDQTAATVQICLSEYRAAPSRARNRPLDPTQAYAKGFSAGWRDHAEYERRARHGGDDYLLGFADGLAAAGGGAR